MINTTTLQNNLQKLYPLIPSIHVFLDDKEGASRALDEAPWYFGRYSVWEFPTDPTKIVEQVGYATDANTITNREDSVSCCILEITTREDSPDKCDLTIWTGD